MNDGPAFSDSWRAPRASLGEGFEVARALPHRGRRSVGPWCFLDHFGPIEVKAGGGMQVGPHPHIGLQTVTWLFEGSVLHRDSLGSVQRVMPGELDLMTAGERGVVHSEQSPPDAPSRLHGVQLWTALPTLTPAIEPGFEHHASLPVREREGEWTCVFLGELEELRSPATRWCGALGAEIRLDAGSHVDFAVPAHHEHGVFVVSGALGPGDATPDAMLYHAPGPERLHFEAREATRLILIGGAPRTEPLHMWWNYVAADRQSIRTAAADWRAGHERFGAVKGFEGPRIEGPEIPAAY